MKKIVVLFVLLLSACSTSKVAKLSPFREIQFGNGGGFTGAISTYCLKADGTLLSHEQKLKKLSCDTLNAIFELVEQLPQEDFIHPGNAYSFIRIISSDTSYYYTWTVENKSNEKIVELYTKLRKQL